MQFTSNRTFQLWDYNVSHQQMLLRSPKTPEIETNVDIVALGVEYLDLPTSLHGLTISAPTHEDVARACQALGCAADPSDVHCFASGGRRFLVVAAACRVLQNDLDLFESSLEYFGETSSSKDSGEVLARS